MIGRVRQRKLLAGGIPDFLGFRNLQPEGGDTGECGYML